MLAFDGGIEYNSDSEDQGGFRLGVPYHLWYTSVLLAAS